MDDQHRGLRRQRPHGAADGHPHGRYGALPARQPLPHTQQPLLHWKEEIDDTFPQWFQHRGCSKLYILWATVSVFFFIVDR